jgi:hypothetical protein
MSRNLNENGSQNGSKKQPKWNQILERSGRMCFFDVFGDRKKSAQNPENQPAELQKKFPGYFWGGPAECAGLPGR